MSALAPSHSVKNADAMPENLVMNDAFQRVVDLVRDKDANLFITGKAGTGKSTLLQLLKKDLKRRGENVVVVAPTGIAALNVRAQTIHSFFKFAPKLLLAEKVHKAKFNRALYQKIDTLIIDEISMVRSDVFNAIDVFLQLTRENKMPFGGVRVILFGDLYQLPPIVREREVAEYLTETLGGPYFFDTAAYKKSYFQRIELDEVFRQKGDDDFIHLLNSARAGTLDDAQLAVLNSRVMIDKSQVAGRNIVYLATTNARANHVNLVKLDRLTTPEKTYTAKVTGKFDPEIFPTDAELKLKVGAQVMVLRNDTARNLANGSIGVVTKLEDDAVTVKVDGQEHAIQYNSWEKVNYTSKISYDGIDEEIAATFKQLPLKLAWAITIHKSQGKTFDDILLDMGHGAFAHGQAYVALSRCRSMAGLFLKHPLTKRDFIVDPRIAEFLDGITN